MKVTIELDVDLDFLMELLKNASISSKGQFLYNLKPREEDLGVLAGRPQSEISKLKLFMEVFNGLSGQDKNDVLKDDFFDELVATGRFTLDQCNEMLEKAERNGQIYQRRKDWYAKA